MIMKQTGTIKVPKPVQKIQTIDGPPLDFSFKNIRHLSQLPQNMPTSNPKTEQSQMKQFAQTGSFSSTSQQNASSNSIKNTVANMNMNLNINEKEKQAQELSEPKLQIVRTIETTDHNYLENQHKKIVSKKEKAEKKPQKIISPQTTALFLRYNKILSIDNFIQLVQPVFPNLISNLMWVDLSHNRLTQLSADLGLLKNLKTLYLHANYISNFGELEKVKKAEQIRTLTIHANPLQQYGQFRIIVHSILPSLKKIDSTLLTKRETERAEVLMKTMKKYPVIKNMKKPPQQSQNSDEDQ